MIVKRTTLDGVAIVDLDFRSDDRGLFARSCDSSELEAAGLERVVDQCSVYYNHKAGTLRMRFRSSTSWRPTTTPGSGTTSTCACSAADRWTASTPPTTSATSRCPPRRPGRCSSTAPPSPRSGEAVTTAKQDLAAGSVLDGLGGYEYDGQAERADVAAAEQLLPIGVAEWCRLLRSGSQGRGPDLRRRRAARGSAGRPASAAADSPAARARARWLT